ncbi:PrgI family protein [Christensenellaceae bacterium OttesenSCG-928-M15]|nr:PrgI family protein [Christensenellaceae bacterium OttesenSCG-928-M15]
MAYVSVPKDISKVKTKVLFGLTKRQLVCFGAAALIGVPLFFLLRAKANATAATLCMIIVMLPFFMLAMYEKNGQPMEKLVKNFIQVRFMRPKHRPYQTNNFYAVLERQAKLDKEVKSIVYKEKRPRQAYKRREKTNRRSNQSGEENG